MKNILLIHGPNLNRLGQRDPHHYGTLTLHDLEEKIKTTAQESGYGLICFQSNHEGALIDFIQNESGKAEGILINPGALTHSSYALHDAIVDSRLPCVEVHLSDIHGREAWRSVSVIQAACLTQFYGEQAESYKKALAHLIHHLKTA